ncbi:hypothetical protein SL1157_0464 [Ruegeria lacuscaerulensis ITI-1157]|nr:hypothetical protein SL1157_0464 [Ruegeria lacuscaerulensis ITI-1157]
MTVTDKARSYRGVIREIRFFNALFDTAARPRHRLTIIQLANTNAKVPLQKLNGELIIRVHAPAL